MLRRVRRRLIPFFICYVVAYIDRVNVGFAARELQRDLRLTSAQYGIPVFCTASPAATPVGCSR